MNWGKKKKSKPSCDSDSEDESLFKNVQIQDNHIYFYGDVDRENAMSLVMAINKFNYEKKKYDEIFLHIQSDGGTVADAFAIIGSILSSRIPINTIVEGSASSAATLISVVGDHRSMNQHAVMLIHQPRGGMFGKKSEMDDEIKNLDLVEKKCKSLYKKYTNLTDKQLKSIFNHDIEWSSKQCLQYGLVDKINKPRKRKRLNS